jgi:glycosyltransferase involved in cell wall biosynthesis
MTVKLWIDVEDLFEYARGNPRPSGIQRLAFEIYKALKARPDSAECIRFVRHETSRNNLRIVQYAEIEALFADLTESVPEPTQQVASPILPHPPSRQFMRKLVHRLPASLRVHVIAVILTSVDAFRSWVGLFDALARGVLIRLKRPFRWIAARFSPGKAVAAPAEEPIPEPAEDSRSDDGDTKETFDAESKPGDILLVLGSPWSHPDYAMLVAAQRTRGLRFALLVYDLIPIRRPEWCDRGLVRIFRAWFDSVFPLCDTVFAISRYTASDVEHYTRERGISLAGPVKAIPIGTSFGVAAKTNLPAVRSSRLPPRDSYALIVSTIEARKNHILLFRIWRRMLEELPGDQVPTLVFAGRVGWLVDDLLRQIANTDNLDGKLVLIENPTDGELRALYEGCRFTLFPSFFEGWGLPVTESQALGKPCLTSNKSSLPEAGGGLTRTFDPDNLHDAYKAVVEVIADPAGLARWTNQIRREFRPVPWSDTADALLSTLGYSPAEALPDIVDFPLQVHAR